MISLRDLKYRIVKNGVVYSTNKEHTVGLFNSAEDTKIVFGSDFLNETQLLKGLPCDFDIVYPDLLGHDFRTAKVDEQNKEIRWEEDGLCFVRLKDNRVLVGAPRVTDYRDGI
jgi:hypothetical protein